MQERRLPSCERLIHLIRRGDTIGVESSRSPLSDGHATPTGSPKSSIGGPSQRRPARVRNAVSPMEVTFRRPDDRNGGTTSD